MATWTGPTLKVATIGCGRMGAQTSPAMRQFAPEHLRILSHLEAVRTLGLASHLAASDIVPAALEQAQATYDLDFATERYDDLIDVFRPDILTVATRTPDKAAIIAAAATAGVRALHVEKPLCNNAAELGEIRRLVDDHGILLTSGCLRRYLDPFRNAARLFAEHQLGDITGVSVGMGAGSLMWTQFHAIDLILFYAGDRRLEWVSANLGPVEWDGDVVVNDPIVLSATLCFEGGFVGTIGPVTGNTTTLSSPGGQLELFADGRHQFLSKQAQAGDPYLSKLALPAQEGGLSGSQAPLFYLARALGRDDTARDLVRRAGRDFLTAQQVAFAFVESDRREGARIPMPEFRTGLTILGMTNGRYA